MSRKGGYKIINFSDHLFESTSYSSLTPKKQDVPGVWDKIEENTKRCVFSGLNVDGKEYADFVITNTRLESNILYIYDLNGIIIKLDTVNDKMWIVKRESIPVTSDISDAEKVDIRLTELIKALENAGIVVREV